jgi:hypothetical protein
MASYFAAVRIVGSALVRYVGVARNEIRRLNPLTFIPYFAAVALSCAGALPNPIGIQLMWQSALPATAGAHSGLLWLRHYIPNAVAPERPIHPIERELYLDRRRSRPVPSLHLRPGPRHYPTSLTPQVSVELPHS